MNTRDDHTIQQTESKTVVFATAQCLSDTKFDTAFLVSIFFIPCAKITHNLLGL